MHWEYVAKGIWKMEISFYILLELLDAQVIGLINWRVQRTVLKPVLSATLPHNQHENTRNKGTPTIPKKSCCSPLSRWRRNEDCDPLLVTAAKWIPCTIEAGGVCVCVGGVGRVQP